MTAKRNALYEKLVKFLPHKIAYKVVVTIYC